MSFLRKMYAQVRVGTTDVPASGGEAYVVRAGCRVTATATTYILTDNPGGLIPDAYCYAIDSSGVEVPNSKFRVNTGSLGAGVTYSSTDSAFKINFSTNPPIDPPDSSWDRIVVDPDYTSSFANFYQTDTAADTPVTSVINLTADGAIEGYVDLRDVDVIVDYNANRTHIVDITTEGREWVTPEDFGAVGDGTTDDAQALQNALDYLSYVQEGGELRLGAKTYAAELSSLSTNQYLTIDKSNVTISGQGGGSVIKQLIEVGSFVGNNVFRTLWVQEGANDVTLRDFEIDDSASATSDGSVMPSRACIEVGGNTTQTARFRAHGLKIRTKNKSGFILTGCDGFTIFNVTVGNNGGQIGGHGVWLLDGTGTEAKRGIISSCQFYDDGTKPGNSGIYVQDVDRVIISDCSIRGWDYGVRFGGTKTGGDLSIDSCHIRNFGEVGIYTTASQETNRVVISGNTINGAQAGKQGIYIKCTANIPYSSINGNSISGTYHSGMVLQNLFYSNVSNNVINDWNAENNNTVGATERLTYQAGIGVAQFCTGTCFSNNQLVNSSTGLEYGFVLSDGIAYSAYIGNTVQGNLDDDYYLETSGDATLNSWLNPTFASGSTQYDIAWGDPDLTAGLLTNDGGITLGGGNILLGTGDVDTEGGDIRSGGGLIDSEGGNVNTGGGAIQEGIIADTTIHRASQYIADGFEAATTVPSGGSYVKSTSTFTADVTGSNMDNSVNNRIKYTGTADRTFLITYTGSCDAQTSPSAADPASFRFYVYDDSLAVGATVAKSQVNRKVTSAGTGAFAMQMIYTLSTNDYVEIHLTRDTSTHTVTVGPGYFSVVEI